MLEATEQVRAEVVGSDSQAALSSQLFSPGLLLPDCLPRRHGRLGRAECPVHPFTPHSAPADPRVCHVHGQVRWLSHGRAGSSPRVEALLRAGPRATSDKAGRVPLLAVGGWGANRAAGSSACALRESHGGWGSPHRVLSPDGGPLRREAGSEEREAEGGGTSGGAAQAELAAATQAGAVGERKSGTGEENSGGAARPGSRNLDGANSPKSANVVEPTLQWEKTGREGWRAGAAAGQG